MVQRFLLACVLFAFCLLAGCSGPPKPVAVSGTVNLDGKPLEDGSIVFLSEKGGTPDTLPIKNGKFDGQASLGKKKVEIRAWRQGKPTKMGDEEIPAPQENYLPDKYNIETTLSAEVSASGINPNKFDVSVK